jgi:membrane-associated protease RseP (regulator of RpoE activity)
VRLNVSDLESSPLPTPGPEPTVGHAPASEIVRAEVKLEPPRPAYRRWAALSLTLFVLTCLSTFFAGATGWMPDALITAGSMDPWGPYFQLPARLMILEHWRDGLIYMGCVLSILLFHEMGHFLMTLVYGVRATLPMCIPLPISPIGTMGAVIAMDGSQADRKQIFDIGLAGPLAGLVLAIPITWIGTARLDLTVPAEGHQFGLPLVVQYMLQHLHPEAVKPNIGIAISQLNPYFMAGWVGLLVTGLNMLPVSQLDGGHVLYALLGRKAHWLARMFMVAVFAYMGITVFIYHRAPMWILMAMLVMLMGTDHPPTRDDSVPLGWFRTGLGYLSLLIPVFCFVPNLVK